MSTRMVLAAVLGIAACYVSPTPAPQAPTVVPQQPGPAEAAPPTDAGPAAPVDPPLLVADPAPPAPPAPAATRVPAGNACFAPGDPRISRVEAAAAAWTRASFDAALAQRGLAPASLAGGTLELHQGLAMGAQRQRGFGSGQVVDTTVEGVSGRFIAGPIAWSGNAGVPERWELVSDARGDVYRVVRNPLPSSESKRIVLCGCAPQRCGPYGSGCPACGVTYQAMFGPLPANATYRGEIRIDYPAATAQTSYQQTQCPPHPRCPAPPPSMAPR